MTMKILYFFDPHRKIVVAVNESMKEFTRSYELTPLESPGTAEENPSEIIKKEEE